MYAPEGFQLPHPLSSENNPPPELPKYLKHQVYDKPEVFSKVDEHAIQVSSCEHPAFRDLMWDLVYRYKLDELERARVIFRWMSSKDMQTIRFVSAPPNSPEEVLLSFKYNRGTFARIFEVMCSYSGIHCITVSGYAKGVDYLPGDRFSGLPANHSWNVIYIRGSWQLVDAHWAARYLSSGKNLPENVVYEYDDFYFMIEPQQAVYSHFPEDSRWQLLPTPLTLSQFENLPLTKSQFFKCAIDFLDQHHGVVHTRDGRLRMTLGFWRPGGFTYKLQYLITSAGHPNPEALVANPADLRDQVPKINMELKSFLLQETTRDRLNFYFRLPASGVYYLTIYAQELASLKVGRESTFRAACEYKIICDTPAVDAQPYPTCHDANWGPAWPHVQHYALEPSHTDGVISLCAKADWSPTVDQRSPPPMTIDVLFGKQRPEVNLLAKLHRNGVPDDYLDQYQRVSETVQETRFHVTLPEPGEYGLEIYANEPSEGDTYTHMCQYLVHYEAPPGWRPTPRLTASGADAGPSAEAVHAWRQSAGSGMIGTDRVTRQADRNHHNSTYWSGENQGSLREMYDYESHAPSLGQLPRPYAASQYAESVQNANRVSSKYNDLPSPPPNARFPSDQDGYERYYQGSGGLKLADRSGAPDHFTMPPPPSSGTLDEHGRLTDQLAGLHMRQSSSPTRANPPDSQTNSPSYQQLMSLSPNQLNHEYHPTDELSLVPPPPLSPHTYPYESERLLRERVCRTRVRADRSPSTEDAFFQAQPYMAGVAVGMSPVPDRREWPTFTHTLSRLPQSSTGAARWKNTSPVRSLSGTSFNSVSESGGVIAPLPYNMVRLPYSGYTGPHSDSTIPEARYGPAPGASSPSYNTSSPRASSPYTSHNVAPGGRFGNAEPHYNGAAPYTSPPGSSSSSGPPYRAPCSQQYDQINSTQGGGAAYAPSVATFYRPDRSTANWGTGPIQREPPKEFKPRPLAPEMSVEKPQPQELPSVGDTTVPRFGSFDVFRRVDEHAVSISQQQQDNFNQLIWQLIYARNITDELEKVRVIFLWLCTKDLHRMNFDNVKPDSPEEILMGIRTGKSTYAQIFYTLCRYAGLHCKLLIGYAKGAEYAPGMHFSGRQGQHSWNAVLVDKVWRLVDCHWAARRLIGKRPSPENVRYGLDMFYFLANPGQLIYTHFPHDSDWQLLRHPISLKEFENLAPVKSAFFKYNLNLVTHRNAVIVTVEPEVRVEISFPSGADQYMSFTFGLSIDNKEGSEEYRGLPLSRYGRQEISVRQNKSIFYVRPPRPGAYKLLIYAKHQGASNQTSHSDNGTITDYGSDVNTENMYGAVCEYRLVANFGPNASLPPYPPCQSSSYGPNELAKNYSILPQYSECTLRAQRGCLELRFRLGGPGSNGPPARLMGKLRCTLVAEEALSRSLLQRNVNGGREAVFVVFLPEAGEYGLEIYANNPDRDGNSFFVVWQYIILSDSESPVRGLPSIPPAYLGPMPRFESMGLSTASHSDPFVQANTGELCIQLNTRPDIPLRIMAQLIHASNDVTEDCSQQVLQQMRDNQVFFLIRFPHPGFFKFQIYALPFSEPGESLPGVFNYLLEATQVHRGRNGQVMPFPQQFAQWKEGCYLYTPLDGVISPASSNGGSISGQSDTVSFRVSVPRAHAVAVVVGDDWTHLGKVLDRWEGQVSLKPHWGRERQLALCANYDNGDGNYGTLLEYRLSSR